MIVLTCNYQKKKLKLSKFLTSQFLNIFKWLKIFYPNKTNLKLKIIVPRLESTESIRKYLFKIAGLRIILN